ncbi:hypothetical protein HYU95_04075 [Candidatus Daviesbacteria bacterium]|nr:hypothetical protein [Candidatus Daviesbacteria bacterium]
MQVAADRAVPVLQPRTLLREGRPYTGSLERFGIGLIEHRVDLSERRKRIFFGDAYELKFLGYDGINADFVLNSSAKASVVVLPDRPDLLKLRDLRWVVEQIIKIRSNQSLYNRMPNKAFALPALSNMGHGVV